MWNKRIFYTLILVLLLLSSGGCRKEPEETPPAVAGPTATSSAPTDTPIPPTPAPSPTPIPSPTPAIVSLGLVSLEDESAVTPRLIGQNPAAGEEAPLDGAIELYFDQPMDEAVTGSAWQLVDEAGAAVSGEISWPRPRVLRFKPAADLKPNAKYQARLAGTAAAASGATLLEGLTLTFNTVGDLAVSQVSPAADTVEVAAESTITVIFNRPVVPLLTAAAQADLPNPLELTPAVEGQGEWLNTSVYVFRPSDGLAGGQSYTARVRADVVNEVSASGAALTADYEWSFSVTAPAISYFSLVNRTTSPHDFYENLLLDQPIAVYFQQSMDPASTEAAISMETDMGEAASFVFEWQDEFRTVIFTPTQLLEMGSAYTLSIDQTAQSASGGRLREGLSWYAMTVKSPAVNATWPADGQTQDWFANHFRLEFASPMDSDSLEDRVIFTPEIGEETVGYYDRWDWTLRFYGLTPSTNYTVEILPGMRDLYGNEITEAQTVTFTTAPYEPSAMFNFPAQMSIYRPGGTTEAWVTHRNVSQIEAALYRTSLQQFARLLSGDVDPFSYDPGQEALVWQKAPQVSAPFNRKGFEQLDILDAAGQPLTPGFYFLTLDSPQVEHDRRHLQSQPLIVATANVTLKTTATEAMIWLTDLVSGQPIPGVTMAFYDESFNRIFRATTDADGIIYREGLDLDVGYMGTYYAVTEDPNNEVLGVAISGWSDGVNPFDFGIYADYYLEPGQPTVYVYTDRPVYRPGQPVNFKGIVRLNDDLLYSLPPYKAVDVRIDSFAETVFEESVPLSEFGSFAAEFELADEAALGFYYISIQVDDNWIGSGQFNVAEYRKPVFQVEVEAAESDVLAGDTIQVTVDSQFFSGGAVVNGAVEWRAYASPYTFSAGGALRPYSFTNYEREYLYGFFDGFYNPESLIASGVGQTDSRGRLLFEVPAELSDEDGSLRFNIEATVTDVGGNVVSGRTAVTVHRSQVYPGIKPAQYVGAAGDELAFDLVLVDWDEQPVGNQEVMVSVVERRWYSVQEEDDLGRTIWRSSVEEIPVLEDLSVRLNSRGRGTAEFVPPNGGIYRAYVTAGDEQGNEAAASTYVWVAGDEYVPWRRVNDHSFELIAGSDSYAPGDTAEILIASPFQGTATALVTVERGHIKQYELVELTSNSTIYRLPVSGGMAPNVFVSVMVMKGVDDSNPAPDFKVGMVQFSVEREEQELQVDIVPDRRSTGPGDEISYEVKVSDHEGNPVAAEVSLALVDLAALSISEPNSGPILDHFYSERWLSVNTALLLTRLMDGYQVELVDEAKGGGGGGGDMGIISVREEFPDTAYWQGQVQTGSDGTASVSITLPDNLTTWRMDARAVTLDTKVGQATSDVVATLPLLVSPRTPRFFVVGDTAVVGTSVHNNTGGELEALVTLEAEGVTVHDPLSQLVTVPAGQQALVEWEVTAADTDRVDFVFSVSSGELADASRPTLGTLDGQGIPVYRYAVPETVGTSGQLLDGGAVVESIGLPLYRNFELTEGELTVEVAPSLAAAMTEGLEYLTHYPYECTEQIVSRFLPNVLTTRALKAAGISDRTMETNLAAEVGVALQRLYNRQRADGGWPWWEEDSSDTLVTAYVVQALLEARDSGYTVSDGVIEQGVSFLLRVGLKEVDGLDGRAKFNRQAYLLYVLARADKSVMAEINGLYDQREALDWYARAYLTQAIQMMDAGDPRLAGMQSDFFSAARLSAAGAHWEEAERDYWNWNSDIRTTAVVLDTMIRLDPENPLVANAVRWLMAHRTAGRWSSTQETAWSLMALTDWMAASGELEADYQYEIALNGQLRGNGQADSSTLRDSLRLQFDVGELFDDQLNRLAIGRSDGAGNLYYTAHLQTSLPVEKVPPQNRGITISRSYFDPEDREQPITEMTVGETFLARLTIVVPDTRHYVVVEDFLPAGLEAVDTSLRTSQQVGLPSLYDPGYDWEDIFSQGWGRWFFEHAELRDEKVVLSARTLPAGTYEYTYLVQASTAGEFRVIPPTAQEFYFPEVYGRGEGSLFVVRPRP